MSPEMCDWIPTVSSAWLGLKETITGSIWTWFAYLLLPCLITDGWPDGHLTTTWQDTPPGADQHSQAGLLQDVHIMVVCVPHGPATRVTLSFLTRSSEDISTVAICPLWP